MDIKSFFNLAIEEDVVLVVEDKHKIKPNKLSNEALFQLPFLSMVVLMLSKGKRKPNVQELGQLIGECLERSFSAFKASSQHIGWSSNMRIRTVKALSFLETAKLVEVNNIKSKVTTTQLGKKVIEKALEGNTDLVGNLRIINRNYINICAEKQLRYQI